MAEKKNREEEQSREKESKEAAKEKKATAGAKKPAAKKSQAKKAAEKKKPEVVEEKAAKPEESTSSGAEEAREIVGEEKVEDVTEKRPHGKPEAEQEDELSEEEFRHLVEESLERVTVTDIVLNMMNQLASVGYLKMGLPESVNLKYRDFDQSRLAIDTLEAMLKGAEGKVPEEALKPFQGTLANLRMNFVQIKGRAGGN
jgi:hypothetical protein